MNPYETPLRQNDPIAPAAQEGLRGPLPISLKVVAGLWILTGIYAVVCMILSATSGKFEFEFSVLGIAVGIGLLFRWPPARIGAMIFHFLGKLFSVLAIVLILVGMGGKQEANASGISGVALVAVFFLIVFWMDRVLKRDEIKAIFGVRKPAEGYGDGIPAE